MGVKLKPGILVGKRGGNSTPSPTWKIGPVKPGFVTDQDLIFPSNHHTSTSSLSARKLGANLWEVLPTHSTAAKMSHGCVRVPYRRQQSHKDKGCKLPTQLDEPLDSHHEKPASDSSLKKHIAASLIQHHRSVERNSHALLPVSPASYSSSMEVTPYNPTLTPSSSLDLKGRIGSSSFNLKTSKGLVKVLNQIWSLEEQHSSNMSLVNALKRELDHCRARINKLLREKNMEQDRTRAMVKSMKDELEDERKLRKHSESLHRKLARELSETKTSFASALKEIEEERKARVLLENLSDEFAKGIRDYEQEVRYLKHKPDKDCTNRESPDRLILHLSEAWLDERMQMQQAKPCDGHEKDTIVDKLSLEIETFLRAKHSLNMNELSSKLSSKKPTGSSLRGHSLESFHLNDAISAPRNANGEDSTSSDSDCFESHLKENRKLSMRKKVLPHKSKGKIGIKDQFEVRNSELLEVSEITKGTREKKKRSIGNPRVNSNHVLDKLIRNHLLSLEGEKPREDLKASENSSRWAHGIKESTLKAMLLEARLEGQHSHSKASNRSS